MEGEEARQRKGATVTPGRLYRRRPGRRSTGAYRPDALLRGARRAFPLNTWRLLRSFDSRRSDETGIVEAHVVDYRRERAIGGVGDHERPAGELGMRLGGVDQRTGLRSKKHTPQPQ